MDVSATIHNDQVQARAEAQWVFGQDKRPGQDAPESRPCSRITTMDAGPVAITPVGVTQMKRLGLWPW